MSNRMQSYTANPYGREKVHISTEQIFTGAMDYNLAMQLFHSDVSDLYVRQHM